MTIPFPLPSSPGQARQIQDDLRPALILHDDFGALSSLAGADVHFPNRQTARAAVMVFSLPDLEVVEEIIVEGQVTFPYITGLLSFREIPILLKAWEKLSTRPDILVLDGQGYAHPRRLGLASHIGLVLGMPTIGCAKSRLIGDYTEPGENRGDQSYLTHNKEVIGVVLRTRDRTRPVFVSPGHRVALSTAAALCLTWARYRVPEPTRRAHQILTKA